MLLKKFFKRFPSHKDDKSILSSYKHNTMLQTIAVIGATGIQGGSVVATLIKEGNYNVRGITRDMSSLKAQYLSSIGVELVVADLNDEASLIKAFEVSNPLLTTSSINHFQGVAAIYAVTDFFEPFSTNGPIKAIEIEYAQGLNIVNAAIKSRTLKHFIWSTLANGSALSGGEFKIPHFEAKNKVDAYIKNNASLLGRTTFLWNTYYASNFTFPMFTPNLLQTSGKYIWIQCTPPSTAISLLGDQNSNVGPFVSAILAQPQKTLGRFVKASTETLTNGEVLQVWERATGKSAVYVQSTLEEFNTLWPMWGLEMGEMLKMWEALGASSWGGEEVLTKEDLGITGLVGLEEAFGKMDWNAILGEKA
jgi:hypothetical protein